MAKQQPSWVQYVQDHIGTAQLPGMLGASSSGVLFIPSGKRLLAVTFGYGRFLLRQEALVQDFGLKVVLNTVDPGQIKSVDARTFDELTVHTRRGVSRDSSFSAPVQVPQLSTLADTLLKAYRAKRYQKNGFAFVDYMRAERDPTVRSHLDDQLVQALQAGDLTEMHLAIPEAIDWQEIAGVRFSFKKRKHEPTPDPKVSLYRELRADDVVTTARLKSDRVEAISAVDDQQLRGRWTVYDCVVFETDYDGHLYVLSGGDWYRIKKSYRDEVEAFARTLPELDIGLAPGNDRRRRVRLQRRGGKGDRRFGTGRAADRCRRARSRGAVRSPDTRWNVHPRQEAGTVLNTQPPLRTRHHLDPNAAPRSEVPAR